MFKIYLFPNFSVSVVQGIVRSSSIYLKTNNTIFISYLSKAYLFYCTTNFLCVICLQLKFVSDIIIFVCSVSSVITVFYHSIFSAPLAIASSHKTLKGAEKWPKQSENFIQIMKQAQTFLEQRNTYLCIIEFFRKMGC